MSDITMNSFYDNFMEEVALASDLKHMDGSQDFFTAVMLEYLEEAGEIDNPSYVHSGYGLQLKHILFQEKMIRLIFLSVYIMKRKLTISFKNTFDSNKKRHTFIS